MEGVKPPAWGRSPHSPFLKLIVATYLQFGKLEYPGSLNLLDRFGDRSRAHRSDIV